MDIKKLKMITPCSWEARGARLFGSAPLIAEMDEKVLE